MRSDKTATEILSAHGWNLERGLDHFFSNRARYPTSSSSSSSPSSSSSKADAAKINRIFDQYADADDKDTSSGENLARFFTDLGVDPSSMLTLAYAWALHCRTFGEIARKEFVAHCTAAGMDSMDRIRQHALGLQATLKVEAQYKVFYRWLFDFVSHVPAVPACPTTRIRSTL